MALPWEFSKQAPTTPRPSNGGPTAPDWLETAPPIWEQPNLPPIGKPVVGEVYTPGQDCKPNLPPIEKPVVGEVGGRLEEVLASVVRAKGLLEGETGLEFLPLLGQTGFIVKGWSHLIAGYPKAGKTELLTRLVREWQDEKVLYFTEEPRSVWAARLAKLEGSWEHVTLVFALGAEPEDILERIMGGRETGVVIDTVRNLLGLKDETDNSEVARALNPIIAACRAGGKTLLMAHHVRKGGGEHGEGITGGHAFLGVVDIALEVLRDNDENKRKVRGWGRVIAIPELLYTSQEDGSFVALGAPSQVELQEVKLRVLDTLNGEWQSRKDILAALDEPKPGLEQLRVALEALVAEGTVVRDPALPKPGATYRYRLAEAVSEPNLPQTLL